MSASSVCDFKSFDIAVTLRMENWNVSESLVRNIYLFASWKPVSSLLIVFARKVMLHILLGFNIL